MLLSIVLLLLWIVDLPYLVHFVHRRWVKENKFSFLPWNLTHMLLISLCSYTVEDTGPVNQISWTPDNCAFAVGWRYRGLAVWSASGCRLMCTIRQGSMSNSQSVSFSPHFGNGIARSEPMVEGVAALTWGQHAYQLFAVEQGNATRLVEFPFAKRLVFFWMLICECV